MRFALSERAQMQLTMWLCDKFCNEGELERPKSPKALQVTADDSRRQGYIQMGEVYLRTATPQVQAHHKRITGIEKDISTFWTDKGTYER